MGEPHVLLQRCVSLDNSEIGRSFLARSNHRIYSKELQVDWKPSGDAIACLGKGTFVAMKQFCSNTSKREMKELCRKEYDILQNCSHENVVTVLEICLEVDDSNPESWPYFLMELGECSLQFALTLKRRGTEDEFVYPTGDGGYSWHHCISWLRQVANAMAYLHNNGIIHRDLKGTNVLLFDQKTICKVCDFDMSRYYDPEGMTIDVGTWRWMAPEVRNWRGSTKKQRYNLKVDCYSFGILACEAVFRQRPFDCYDDRILSKLDVPGTPLVEDTDATLGAMTLEREVVDEQATLRVNLNRCRSVFPLSDKMWQLMDDLLAWKPSQRPNMGLVMSRLAIEPPTLAIGEDSDVEAANRSPPLVASDEAAVQLEMEQPQSQQRTDTGLPGVNFICPSIPSVCRTVSVLYATQLTDGGRLSLEEKERIVEVLKAHSSDVISFYEDEQADPDLERQPVDGDHRPSLQSHFRFTDSGDQLEHALSGADHTTRQGVAEVCSRSGGKFQAWLAKLFRREGNHRRLRGIQFQTASSS